MIPRLITIFVALTCVGTPLSASNELLESKACIAHGGAASYAPFHTMASYRLALKMKADYVETDLQLSKDGHLVCIHDLSLNRSTNVEAVYPNRYRESEREGEHVKTWLVNDFTLEELKQLDAGSWFSPEFAGERLVSFQELIDLVKGKAGLYPETKDPDYYSEKGIDIDQELHEALMANGLLTPESLETTPIIVQSFHENSLRRLRELGGESYRLVQLIWFGQFDDFMTPEGMKSVAEYADGLGPFLSMVLPNNGAVVREAHRAGLAVHAWHLYEAIPGEGFDSEKAYMDHLLYEIGLDGLFTESPDQFPRR